MPRTPLLRFSGLALALSLAACAAYQAQHGGAPTAVPGAHEAALAVAKPSGEYCELPVDAQAARLRGEVEHTKAELANQGRYDCCVAPACSHCLMHHGECHCREMVRKGGPACGECTEGWIEGKGQVEGVDARDLVERQKTALQGTGKPGGGN